MTFLESLRRLLNFCKHQYGCEPVAMYCPADYEPGAISDLSKSSTEFELDTKRGFYRIYGVRVYFRKTVPSWRHPAMVFSGGMNG